MQVYACLFTESKGRMKNVNKRKETGKAGNLTKRHGRGNIGAIEAKERDSGGGGMAAGRGSGICERMAKTLIIVESPAKTKTLKNFLGGDYVIEASMGHVRDLPKGKLGVDVDNDFAPTYQAITDRKDVLRRLTAAAKGVGRVLLASDPDREGEAIAWHLSEALGLKNAQRIQFNEITKSAVQQAISQPRLIDIDRVNAQQARRVLDRLIGYKLSPVLSSKIQKGLSAGRVQSVAVRLICEREREIQAFIPEEYWSLTATLTPIAPEKRFLFPAKLHSRGGEKLDPKSQEDMDAILRDLEGARYRVSDVKKREQKRNASAPFITSTLQQEASRKLGFGNRRTMSVAQDLYEGVDIGKEGSVGLITYMRSDSVRIANEAQIEARQFIGEKYGPAYIPAAPKQFKTKGAAQDAHEAIRPTSAYREPDLIAQYLSSDQLRLYRLIYQRFLASQMNPAIMDVTTADIAANLREDRQQAIAPNTQHPISNTPYNFRSTGSVMKFDGFMRVYTEGKDTEEVSDDEQPPLPPLSKDQDLALEKLDPRQHFTEPPPRYTEATIVKTLEEQGIGRPSTYANIISTIRDREYVDLRDKRFYPTELGFKVNDQLVKHFPSILDLKFTADMETKLDDVEEGKADWVGLLRNFYDPFALTVERAKTEMENIKPPAVETEYVCPVSEKAMLLRTGRFGPFMGCGAYPKCKKIIKLNPDESPVDPPGSPNFICGMEASDGKSTVDPSTLENATAHICPAGNGGVMLTRASRFGPFLGCSNYPKCRTTLKTQPDGALLEGQEFNCTFSEANAKKGKAGGRKTATKTTAKAAPEKAPSKTTAKATAAKKPAAKTTATKAAAATKTTTAKKPAAMTATATKAAPKSRAKADTAETGAAPVKRAVRKPAATSVENEA